MENNTRKWNKAEPRLPDQKSLLVECIAEIRNNITGEVREFETCETMQYGMAHPDTYIWEDGNYSCDCNRVIFFRQAGNESQLHWNCGLCTDGDYSVNLKNKRDGWVYYREF